jgi:hypothetical protein
MAESAAAALNGNSPAMSSITKRKYIDDAFFGKKSTIDSLARTHPLSQRERGCCLVASPSAQVTMEE